MYTNYYSSSDVQLYLTSLDHTKMVKVDTSLSIGYSLRQTSAPIYSLGSRKIQFYSHGNTLGNGNLTIAFTDEEYLKYCLSEVGYENYKVTYQTENDSTTNGASNYAQNISVGGSYRSTRLKGNAMFKKSSASVGDYGVTGNKRLISIGAIKPLFNIKLYINNESLIRGSDTKIITLQGCKLIGENFSVSSTADAPLMLSYNFMFKDIERG